MAPKASLEVKRDLCWKFLGYEPGPEQLEMHSNPYRINLVGGGERAGKSYSAAMEMMGNFILGKLFWFVGPDYDQTRQEFEYCEEAATKLGALVKSNKPSEGPCHLYLLGGERKGEYIEIHTKSAKDPRKLGSVPPDGIVMCESAQCPPETFSKMRGRIAQTRGWLILTGTFESDRDWYAQLWHTMKGPNIYGGKSYSLPTWSNKKVFPGGRQDPEIQALERSCPPDYFLMRYGGEPQKPAELVYREFDEAVHVRPCPFDRSLPVSLAIDPGYRGAYAVLALQQHGNEVWQIDEVYEQFEIAQKVIPMCKAKPWWGNVEDAVADVAATQHHATHSQEEIWKDLTRGHPLHPDGIRLKHRPVKIHEGILRHRTFLFDPKDGNPRLFHDPSCVKTIWEYQNYKYKKAMEGRPLDEDPVDANNHSLKAIVYWLFGKFGHVDRVPVKATGLNMYYRYN